jgi:hypothetical protein
MNNISVPQFFKDFTGTIDDFRLLIDNLSRGTADRDKYGDAEEQLKLLNELHNSFVGIHPTDANNSVQTTDLGEWFYYNHRYYHMRGGSGGGVQGAQGARGTQGVQGIQGASGGGAGVIENAIEVSANVGGYNAGDTIEAGTDYETIIRTLLTSVIDVATIAPSPTKNFSGFPSSSTPVEVGTLKSFTLNVNWVDGYFESADPTIYTDARFDELNHTTGGKLAAQCTQGTVTYSGVGLPGNTNNVVSNLVVGAQTYTYTAHVPWSQSSKIAKMSNGEDSNKRIAASSKDLSSSFTGKYKFFYGFIEGRVAEPGYTPDYSDVITSQADLNDSSKFIKPSDGSSGIAWDWLNNATNAATITLNSNGKEPYTAHVIVIPTGFYIASAKNAAGTPVEHIDEVYEFINNFTYTNGGTTTTYNVYIHHSLPTVGGEYKDIKINRS